MRSAKSVVVFFSVILVGLGVLAPSEREAIAVGATPATPPAGATLSPVSRAIVNCAAVVEGTVSEVAFEYSEALGPRTVARLNALKLHAGSLPPEGDLVIKAFGGFLPDGRFAGASDIPLLVEGKRYLLLLKKGSWFWSPLAFDTALAIETVEGTEVLVNEEGVFLREVSLTGLKFSAERLFEPRHVGGDGKVAAPSRTHANGVDNVTEALTVERAVAALVEAAAADGVAFTGVPTQPVATWFPWNRGPFAKEEKQ